MANEIEVYQKAEQISTTEESPIGRITVGDKVKYMCGVSFRKKVGTIQDIRISNQSHRGAFVVVKNTLLFADQLVG